MLKYVFNVLFSMKIFHLPENGIVNNMGICFQWSVWPNSTICRHVLSSQTTGINIMLNLCF